MKSIQIKNSYHIWSTNEMKYLIQCKVLNQYNTPSADRFLHRTYESMYMEWWLHNIGYYLTKLLCWNDYFKHINKRFKHVDLEEWCDNND